MHQSMILPPKSWLHPSSHWVSVLTSEYYAQLVQVQGCLNDGIHAFFRSRGLQGVDLPVTTGSISSPIALGSDSVPVSVELLGQKTYLADSMQFLLEMGCRMHPNGVYYKAVSFRGEHVDSTHLQQFHHVECEVPGGLDTILSLGNDLVHTLCLHLLQTCSDSISLLAGSVSHLEQLLSLDRRIPRLTMEEATNEIARINNDGVLIHPLGFRLLTRLGEDIIVRRKGNGLALWITDFPLLSVPFYQAAKREQGSLALCGDLLVGGREVLGCGERHYSPEQLRNALKFHQVFEEPYEWYVKMREISPMQTAGFGLGTERFLMWVLKQDDIRDCTLLVRDSQVSCDP